MKKRIVLSLIAIGLLLAGVLQLTTNVHAVEMLNTENEEGTYTVKDAVNDDLYLAAEERVVIEKDVNGDLFVGAGTVEVKGMVLGDVYCAGGLLYLEENVDGMVLIAGGQLEVNGNVRGNVFAFGGTIKISGNVMGDVMTGGGQITIEGKVDDDVRAAGGMISIKDDVDGDVLASGGTVTLDGNVGGDVYVSSGQLDVNSPSIGGDLVFYGDESYLNVDTDTEVGGTTTVEEQPAIPVDVKTGVQPFFKDMNLFGSLFGFAFSFVWALVKAVGLIILGLLLFKFIPVKSESVIVKMSDTSNVASSLGIGCLAIPVGLVVGLVLLIPFFWPVLGVVTALAAIAKLIAVPLVGTLLGRWILSAFGSKNKYALPLTVGVLIIQLLTLIPCGGGWLVSSVVFLLGLGAMLRMWYEKHKKASEMMKKKKKK